VNVSVCGSLFHSDKSDFALSGGYIANTDSVTPRGQRSDADSALTDAVRRTTPAATDSRSRCLRSAASISSTVSPAAARPSLEFGDEILTQFRSEVAASTPRHLLRVEPVLWNE